MSIRRLQYQLDYVHILTFREEYKYFMPLFFGLDGLEYAIDNESTLNEQIRLIFKNEKMAIIFRKEAITVIYEGDIEIFKNAAGPMKIFFDMTDQIKLFKGFSRFSRHSIVAHDVEITDKEEVKNLLSKNSSFIKNFFEDLDEVAIISEFKRQILGW